MSRFGLPSRARNGHAQVGWLARNDPFPDPATLSVQPDHFVFRIAL
jgi:glucuronate isomerase